MRQELEMEEKERAPRHQMNEILLAGRNENINAPNITLVNPALSEKLIWSFYIMFTKLPEASNSVTGGSKEGRQYSHWQAIARQVVNPVFCNQRELWVF